MHQLLSNSLPNTKAMLYTKSLPQGIKSLEDFDVLARMNIYPLNLLSETGKAEFRSRLRFREYNGDTIVNGVGYNAIHELGYRKYVDLIKIITGKNPVIDGKRPPYDPRYPDGTGGWRPGQEPRPEANHACCKSGGSMCWVPPGNDNPPCPYIKPYKGKIHF